MSLLLGAGLLAAALGACASRPPAALTPVIAPADAAIVPLLVSTTRRPEADPALMFGGQRTLRPRFARLAISIPPTHRPGDIAWSTSLPPDPRVSFAATEADYIAPEAFIPALRQRIRETRRSHVLVFVHGYNTRFDEAAFRFAQIVHDSRAGVTPVLYSWPSWGTLSAYPYDRTSASIARDGLEALLATLARDPAVSEISVLAHSMGGWLAMEALRQMGIRNRTINPKIRNLMLAAPDIDVDVAAEQVRSFASGGPKISLFISRDDGALRVSRLLWGSSDRLGAIDPNQEPYRTNLARLGIDVVDLTDIEAGDATGHVKFAQSPAVVRSIGTRLAQGQRLAGGQENPVENAVDGVGFITRGAVGVVGDVLTAPLRIGQPGAPAAATTLP